MSFSVGFYYIDLPNIVFRTELINRLKTYLHTPEACIFVFRQGIPPGIDLTKDSLRRFFLAESERKKFYSFKRSGLNFQRLESGDDGLKTVYLCTWEAQRELLRRLTSIRTDIEDELDVV